MGLDREREGGRSVGEMNDSTVKKEVVSDGRGGVQIKWEYTLTGKDKGGKRFAAPVCFALLQRRKPAFFPAALLQAAQWEFILLTLFLC